MNTCVVDTASHARKRVARCKSRDAWSKMIFNADCVAWYAGWGLKLLEKVLTTKV